MKVKKEKECTGCKVVKPLDQFYKRTRKWSRDGYYQKCKECLIAYSLLQKRATYNPEKAREYSKRRTASGKALEASRRMQVLYPEKYKARYECRQAIRSGKLIKQPCEVCGEAKVEAHHDDYSKPLDVRWLCKKHHSLHHRKEVVLPFKLNARTPITIGSETKLMTDWAEKYKISVKTIGSRIKLLGWDVERAITTPSNHAFYPYKKP